MKNRSEIGQSSVASRLPKTHEDYWKKRLRRRTYEVADGQLREVPEWQVRLSRGGKQRWINLETANRDAAAKKARDTWLKLQAAGWDAVKPAAKEIADPTVGDFLAAVRAEADLQPATFEIYARKFRRLVAGAFGIRGEAEKHDHVHGGHQRWLSRVHAVRFSRITTRAIQRWKTKYLAAAASSPLKDRKARRTVASILRSSKALFARGVIGKLHIRLPSPLPLDGVDVPRVSVQQYVSRINPEILFQQAKRELESPTDEALMVGARPNIIAGLSASADVALAWREQERVTRHQMFRVFTLALFAGLRRDEIDTLTWAQIDFAEHSVRVETNEFTRAKSLGSEASVDIDPSFSELLRSWMAKSESKFVIDVPVQPRPDVSSYHHYRCDRIFKRLTKWLQARGVEERNPLHALRKEFGTQINRTHGLFAASAALRHSSIQLTRSTYVAKKDRAVFTLPQQSEQPKAGVA